MRVVPGVDYAPRVHEEPAKAAVVAVPDRKTATALIFGIIFLDMMGVG